MLLTCARALKVQAEFSVNTEIKEITMLLDLVLVQEKLELESAEASRPA